MVIYAKPSKQGDYEKVKIDEWLIAEIVEVQEKLDVEKTYKDKDTGETQTRKIDQVRFKFSIEDYEYPHYSRWMNASTNENSTLYKKYIRSLFGTKYAPDTLLDVDRMVSLKVKTMWDEVETKNGGVFQFVDKLRLLDPEDVNRVDLAVEEQPEEAELQTKLDEILPEEGQEASTPY